MSAIKLKKVLNQDVPHGTYMENISMGLVSQWIMKQQHVATCLIVDSSVLLVTKLQRVYEHNSLQCEGIKQVLKDSHQHGEGLAYRHNGHIGRDEILRFLGYTLKQ